MVAEASNVYFSVTALYCKVIPYDILYLSYHHEIDNNSLRVEHDDDGLMWRCMIREIT